MSWPTLISGVFKGVCWLFLTHALNPSSFLNCRERQWPHGSHHRPPRFWLFLAIGEPQQEAEGRREMLGHLSVCHIFSSTGFVGFPGGHRPKSFAELYPGYVRASSPYFLQAQHDNSCWAPLDLGPVISLSWLSWTLPVLVWQIPFLSFPQNYPECYGDNVNDSSLRSCSVLLSHHNHLFRRVSLSRVDTGGKHNLESRWLN